MRKKLRVAIGILSLVAVAFTIISFIFRLNEAKSSGELASGAEYSILRNAITSITAKEDFQDRFTRDRLLALYEGSTRLLAAQVLDENGLSVWKVPAESKYFALPNQKGARAGFNSPQWSTVVFTTPLAGNLRLVALYASVFTSDISNAAKLPAYFIGIWFLIILVLSFFVTKDRTDALLPEPIDTKGTAERQSNEPIREMAQTQEGLIEISPVEKQSQQAQKTSDQTMEATISESENPEAEFKDNEQKSAAAVPDTATKFEHTLVQPPSAPQSPRQEMSHQEAKSAEPESLTPADTVSGASIIPSQPSDVELSPELLAAYGLSLNAFEKSAGGRVENPQTKPAEQRNVGRSDEVLQNLNTLKSAPIAQPQTKAPLQGSIQGPLPKSGNFEESLQKFEEEIILWTSRQKQAEPAQPTAQEPAQGWKHPENHPEPLSQDQQLSPQEPAQGWKHLESQPNPLDLGEPVPSPEPRPSPMSTPKQAAPAADKNSSEMQELPEGLDQEIEETLEEMETEEPAPMNHGEPPIKAYPQAPEPESQEQDKRNISSLPMPLSISEPNLENLLDDELTHGMERDTSLMLIHCELSGPHDPAANALFATIRDYFVAKELMFELYKGGFAVVMPGMDLGSSLKMSEDLADVLAATMNLYKDMEGEPPVFIGISSAGGRAVDAQKLYREASTALHKAYSGSPWHILAFRPKVTQQP